MTALRLLFEKIRALTRRRQDDAALGQEINLHLELLEERLRARGLSPEEAHREARRAFGGVQQLREAHRDARTGRWLTEAAQDVSHAMRMLRREPGFAIVALLTIALGIGANTAVFSAVHAVILRPLPYPSPDRVERVGWNWDGRSPATASLAPFKFEYLRERTRVFESLATWQVSTVESGAGTVNAPVRVLRASADFFDVVGAGPAQGRGFTTDERASGAEVAMVTGSFWQTRLGRDASVLGRTLRLDDRSVVVVGVLPVTFEFPELVDPIDVVTPLALRADSSDLGANFPVMGRLRQGVTRAVAQEDVDRVFDDLRRERPNQFAGPAERAVLMRFDEIHLAQVTRPLWTLFAGVLVVLLIACTNVANLLLGRGTTRLREMAVRTALGASRGRLVRQGIAEGLVMSAIGGVAGIALGIAGLRLLVGLAPGGIARLDAASIDTLVLGFVALIVTITGIVFGLAATGIGTMPRSGSVSLAARGSTATRTGRRLRQLLVSMESALTMLLLVGAVLLVSGFFRLTRTPLGFDPDGLIAVIFPRLSPELRTPTRMAAAERALREGLAAVPGVSAAASSSIAPLAERGWNMPMTIDGRPDATEGAVEWRAVSREYAAVMGLTLVQGRWLSNEDVIGGRPVIVVSAGFATRYFPDGVVLGQRVWLGVFRGERRPGSTDSPREIVGVVADIRDLGPTRPMRRTVFIPQAVGQSGGGGLPAFVIRASSAVSHDALRAAVRAADPALPEPLVSTMASRLGTRVARDRFSSLLMAAFATVALVLTTVGVYGVVAWVVRHARREIGIRIALGAGGRRIMGEVLRRGLVPVGIGLGVGAVAAIAASGLFTGLVIGATTISAQIAIAAAAVLIAAATVAAWIPARRALTVDPVATLRED